ncbi:MAG: preprotein translocase subunit SecD, partial [Candidatus Methanofastidiosia archaeon]
MNKLLRDFRVLLLLSAILLSIFFIRPTYSDGEIKTNLKFGLELAGGSYIRLALEGEMVQVDLDTNAIVEYEIEELLGKDIILINSVGNVMEFEVELTEDEKKNLEKIPFGSAEFNQNLKIDAKPDVVIVYYLSKVTKNEVLIVSYKGEKYYEIRGAVSEEELSELIKDYGSITSYLQKVSPQTTKQTKNIILNKLNYLGLQDIKVRVWGEDYILVDLAGKTLEESREIVTQPGKFEIRIFLDEENSELITTGSGIKDVQPFNQDFEGSWGVSFTLTEEAAESFNEKCITYGAVDDPEAHKIGMYLDDQEVFLAPLSPGLAQSIKNGTWRGGGLRATTGSRTKAEQLEIHLRAGSLPVKPRIVGEGETPPELGKAFLRQVIQAIVGALTIVALIVFLRYREAKIVIPLLGASLSETLIVLGFAALVGHQLDLPSIAGIIATLGTGVDQLVIITDEVLRG